MYASDAKNHRCNKYVARPIVMLVGICIILMMEYHSVYATPIHGRDQGKCDSSRHRMSELAGSVERARAKGKEFTKLCQTYLNSARAWRPEALKDCRGLQGDVVSAGFC
ncbi:hypothetical protein [Burkholderia singularis]|uniref:hypothetical protein n=1 Tax=Burkholderia singularis TaxID=1503053 RepID=UPI0018D2A9DB|nr:hypothetical protein [Burkholderia sp. Bp7605]